MDVYNGCTRWIEDDCPDTFSKFIFLFLSCSCSVSWFLIGWHCWNIKCRVKFWLKQLDWFGKCCALVNTWVNHGTAARLWSWQLGRGRGQHCSIINSIIIYTVLSTHVWFPHIHFRPFCIVFIFDKVLINICLFVQTQSMSLKEYIFWLFFSSTLEKIL